MAIDADKQALTSNDKGSKAQMGAEGATKRQLKQTSHISPELHKLCDEYLEQIVSFAQEFTKLAGLPDEKASPVQNMIVGRCWEAVGMAQIAAQGLVNIPRRRD